MKTLASAAGANFYDKQDSLEPYVEKNQQA
jgi:hypothetical protein